MTEVHLHEITNRALRQWIAVTGVDPDVERNNWTWGEYTINRINDYIRTAQDIDPTGLTAFMVTRAVANDYVKEHTFNAMDLVTGDPATKARLDALGSLVQVVNDPAALEVVREFQDYLKVAADHYNVRANVAASIEDQDLLSHIRRDALLCTTMLDRHTFAKGKRSGRLLKYNERVLKFWNVNSLVRAAQVQPEDGISIALVRDPNVVEYSFFCFLVKDGENITIWTDMEKGAHPMQKYKSRSAGRARNLKERASRLRFPYQLLEVTFDDEGKHAFEVKGADLVKTNVEAVAISRIEDLEPDQILWAIMALDKLRDAGHNETLSVTGEGLTRKLPPGSRVALPPGYGDAKVLTNSDVTTEAVDKHLKEFYGYATRTTGVNTWMEERYGKQVDQRLLNLTQPPSTKALASFDEDEDEDGVSQEMVLIGGDLVNASELLPEARGVRTHGAYSGTDQVAEPRLIGTDPVAFGTPKEMEADRLWIARWNQAQAISMAAVAEFDEKREEIERWFASSVKNNSTALITAMVRGEFIVPSTMSRRGADFGNAEKKPDNLIRWHRRTKNGGGLPTAWSEWFCDGENACVGLYGKSQARYSSSKDPLRCYLTGEAARCWCLMQPSTPEGVAALAGVRLEDLPELLRYWNPNPPYCGNSILDRTDPLDSEVGNPWTALTFKVMIGLSKRGWNRCVKDLDGGSKARFKIQKVSGYRDTVYWGYEDEDEDDD